MKKLEDELPTFQNMPNETFIRLRTLYRLGVLPFSRSTLWRLVKFKKFPAPIKISTQIVAWRVGEIKEWLENPKEYIADANN